MKLGQEFFVAFKSAPKALKYLLEAYYERDTHCVGDSLTSAFCAGRRAVVIDILDGMRLENKEQYARLMMEICLIPDEKPGTDFDEEDL